MPIENLDDEMPNDKIVMQNKDVFVQNNTVIAGFTVKSPLFDCKLQLIGFTHHYPADQEKIQVIGMRYHQINSYTFYDIYPKLVIDLKQNQYNHYVDDESEIKVNYYYYINITDKYAKHGVDVIYAVCKYREDGILKHAFFNLHEITPDV